MWIVLAVAAASEPSWVQQVPFDQRVVSLLDAGAEPRSPLRYSGAAEIDTTFDQRAVVKTRRGRVFQDEAIRGARCVVSVPTGEGLQVTHLFQVEGGLNIDLVLGVSGRGELLTQRWTVSDPGLLRPAQRIAVAMHAPMLPLEEVGIGGQWEVLGYDVREGPVGWRTVYTLREREADRIVLTAEREEWVATAQLDPGLQDRESTSRVLVEVKSGIVSQLVREEEQTLDVVLTAPQMPGARATSHTASIVRTVAPGPGCDR